ncbi:hypothetical protein MD484_g8441, partial [Candolleomyces efflorescens]
MPPKAKKKQTIDRPPAAAPVAPEPSKPSRTRSSTRNATKSKPPPTQSSSTPTSQPGLSPIPCSGSHCDSDRTNPSSNTKKTGRAAVSSKSSSAGSRTKPQPTSVAADAQASQVVSKNLKTQRRTREEITEEREALQREREELNDQFTECWGRLEEQDREVMAARSSNRVLRLSDIPEWDGGHEDKQMSSGEEFDLNVSPCLSEAGEISDGALREIELLKKRMEMLKLKGSSKAKSRKPEKTTPLASGLRSTVRSAIEASSQPKANAISVEERGLSEDNIQDVRPTTAYHARNTRLDGSGKPLSERALVRNMSRTNQDVTPVASHSAIANTCNTGTPSPQQAPPSQSRRRATAKKRAPLRIQPNATPSPAVSRVQTLPAYPSSSALGLTKRIPGLTAGNVTVDDLPDFATRDGRWKNKFLPALYETLYMSPRPFAGFVLASSEFIELLQKLVSQVYPEVTYTVHHREEPIHLVAYNRINERRGAIAASAVQEVKDHVKSFGVGEFALEQAEDWLVWARRAMGPLYWADPTPAWCIAGAQEDPDFVVQIYHLYRQDGAHVHEKSQQIPSWHSNWVICGCFGRARDMAPNGVLKEKSPPFSQTAWGRAVDRYIKQLNDFTPEQWDSILLACGFRDGEPDELEGDMSLDDHDRMNMFALASPQKRRG